jgi:hypothetical protein
VIYVASYGLSFKINFNVGNAKKIIFNLAGIFPVGTLKLRNNN